MVRVTVYSGIRKAKVEATAISDKDVQFVTGFNYHEEQQTVWEDNYLLTWSEHPEDVAAKKVALGAAITFNPSDFEKQMDGGKQKLLISKPTRKRESWISSANSLKLSSGVVSLGISIMNNSLTSLASVEKTDAN